MYELDAEVPRLPTFELIADALMPLGALNSPAELHGFLCGYLSAGGRFSDRDWTDAAWELLDVVQPPDRDLDDLIADLYTTTLQQMRDGSPGFELLLPHDQTEMQQRVTALGQWCHGFLAGFGGVYSQAEESQLPDSDLSINIDETLEDFAAFVQMQADEDESEGENESNYFEVQEYVRVATLNIFMDVGVQADGGTDAETAEDEGYDDDETLH